MDMGRVAYEAYRASSGGKSAVSGQVLPEWAGQLPEIRQHWRAVADAVLMYADLQAGNPELTPPDPT